MKAIVAAPASEGARYILAEGPAGRGQADLLVEVHASAVNQADLRMPRAHFAGSGSSLRQAIGGLEMEAKSSPWGSVPLASPSATGSWR